MGQENNMINNIMFNLLYMLKMGSKIQKEIYCWMLLTIFWINMPKIAKLRRFILRIVTVAYWVRERVLQKQKRNLWRKCRTQILQTVMKINLNQFLIHLIYNMDWHFVWERIFSGFNRKKKSSNQKSNGDSILSNIRN